MTSKISKIAVIRIRGRRKLKPKIKRTLEMLRLNRPNHCVVVEQTPQTMGMVKVVNDYVAYGRIEEETMYCLLLKRGKKDGAALSAKLNEADIRKIAKEIMDGKKVSEFAAPVFRLHPPKKGLKNPKAHYPRGDAGRREELDTLLRKMM